MAEPTIQQLRQEWEEVFGTLPSPTARHEFLAGNLACQRQVQKHGGLSARTWRELEAIAKGATTRKVEMVIKPGTKLIRMWQGQPHEVTVLGRKQYQYKGGTYTSLSAIANRITGTKWNGKEFFKLV